MNKPTDTQPAPRRRPMHPPRPVPHARPSDPLTRAAAERRLFTDFLALAFYPGMADPRNARTGNDAA